MGTSEGERWREILPGLFHLGDGPDAIVERHPARDEWHWRCPALARGGVAAERGTAMRAARAALRATMPPAAAGDERGGEGAGDE